MHNNHELCCHEMQLYQRKLQYTSTESSRATHAGKWKGPGDLKSETWPYTNDLLENISGRELYLSQTEAINEPLTQRNSCCS